MVNSGSVVNERGKPLRSPSPRSKKLFKLQSQTFHQCTIVAMFNDYKTNNGVHPLQLMEKAARLQSSPQLGGPSSLSLIANRLDNRSQHC